MPGKLKRRDLKALPELEGWVTFTEAAGILGISRQRFYQLAESGAVETARRLGARPTYIVREAEVEGMKEQRQLGSPEPPAQVEAALFLSIGGIVVTGDDLRQAVAILEDSSMSRGSFKQSMAKLGNPLGTSDYMGTAKQYRATHPEARGLNTKQVLLEAYRRELTLSVVLALPA